MWAQRGSDFKIRFGVNVHDTLPVGSYNLQYNGTTGEFWVSSVVVKSHGKVYDFDESFIARCLQTYEREERNLGVLLYGLKGTGKSVCALQICKRSGIPVIIIDKYYSGMFKFLATIQHEFILLIDEYEKLFKNHEDALLSVMDGALDTEHKRMFILTSNTCAINEFMIERPGRIRYTREYKSLPKSVTVAVVTDMLATNATMAADAVSTGVVSTTLPTPLPTIEEIVKFIGTLNIITIDIVKTVVLEVIAGEALKDLPEFLNVRLIESKVKLEFVKGLRAEGDMCEVAIIEDNSARWVENSTGLPCTPKISKGFVRGSTPQMGYSVYCGGTNIGATVYIDEDRLFTTMYSNDEDDDSFSLAEWKIMYQQNTHDGY
tara:strand:- start:4624 stop:5751 length:1128 start_codon:yes stop_codon:yes gene_type:complete